MMEFLQLLRTAVAACGLPGTRVLLAVSGGADSVAMVRGLLALRETCDLQLWLAHLNHNLRGEESQADVEWLTRFAQGFGLPLVVESQNVAAIAQSRGQGIEETARQVRHAFLEKTAEELGCSHIAVAHTADDQAETILHHVVRGTGLRGLRGMVSVRPLASGVLLARPLLEVRRSQVEAYLAELGQDFCHDVSNIDERFTRNRLRHTLLPHLERQFNPRVRDALLRLGLQSREAQETLEELARRLLGRAVLDSSETSCRLDCTALADQPRHLIRECFLQLWKDRHWPRQQMGFAEWDSLAELVRAAGTTTLPGKIEARRRGRLLVLQRR